MGASCQFCICSVLCFQYSGNMTNYWRLLECQGLLQPCRLASSGQRSQLHCPPQTDCLSTTQPTQCITRTVSASIWMHGVQGWCLLMLLLHEDKDTAAACGAMTLG